MSEQIKNCPCCGGCGVLKVIDFYVFAWCSQCGMGTRPLKSVQEAIEIWNKRVQIEIDRKKLAEALYGIIYDGNEVVTDLIFKMRMKDLRDDADRIIEMMKGY